MVRRGERSNVPEGNIGVRRSLKEEAAQNYSSEFDLNQKELI
jgi:hypothetical protein